MLKLGGPRRTDGTTVDSRRGDAHEDQAIKAGVPALQSTITSFSAGQFHELIFAFRMEGNWRFSDVVRFRIVGRSCQLANYLRIWTASCRLSANVSTLFANGVGIGERKKSHLSVNTCFPSS